MLPITELAAILRCCGASALFPFSPSSRSLGQKIPETSRNKTGYIRDCLLLRTMCLTILVGHVQAGLSSGQPSNFFFFVMADNACRYDNPRADVKIARRISTSDAGLFFFLCSNHFPHIISDLPYLCGVYNLD